MAEINILPTQVKAYSTLEELRNDKMKLACEIRKSVKTVSYGVKQSFLPDSDYLNSSNRYMRFIGYGLTAWKTAKMVNKFVSFFKKN